MSSGPPHQQGVVDALVQSILKRDILFVLYHLKELEPSRINQVDSRHRLSPLQAALSLPQDGPRRAILLQIFLLSGAYLSLAERLDGPGFGRGPSDGRLLPHWARGTENEATPARMLLYEIPLEEAERWLRKNGLDVPEVYNAAEGRRDRPDVMAYPTPPGQSAGAYDPSRPQYGDARPPYPPSRSVEQPFPSYQDPFAPDRGRPATSHEPPHFHHRPPSPSFQPGPQTFVLEGLAHVTSSADLARFLGRFFKDDRLVEAITLAPPARGTKAFRVVLAKAVDVRELELLHGSQLDGVSMRVQVEASSASFPTSAPRLPFPASAPRPPYRGNSPPPRRQSLNERRRSLSPRRAVDNHRRDPSPTRAGRNQPSSNIWAPHSSCIYAYNEADRDRARPPPPPREGATQRELDVWAEESFVGRWASDFRGVRPKWEKGRGVIWRGELCPAFPPRVGGIKPCWGRNCNHAHAPEELRIDEHGTLRDPAAAAAFAKRPWRAPSPITSRSSTDGRRRSPSPPRRREDRPPPRFEDRAPPRFDDRLPPRLEDRPPPRFDDNHRAPPPRFDQGRRSPPRGGSGRH